MIGNVKYMMDRKRKSQSISHGGSSTQCDEIFSLCSYAERGSRDQNFPEPIFLGNVVSSTLFFLQGRQTNSICNHLQCNNILMGPQQSSNSPSYNFDIVTIRVISGPDCKRLVWTLTGVTQTGTIKFTWARPESMKWFHETGTRLQISMNVYMKHGGSSYFSFVICFIVPFIVKCCTANKNTAESEEKRENYSISSPHL